MNGNMSLNLHAFLCTGEQNERLTRELLRIALQMEKEQPGFAYAAGHLAAVHLEKTVAAANAANDAAAEGERR